MKMKKYWKRPCVFHWQVRSSYTEDIKLNARLQETMTYDVDLWVTSVLSRINSKGKSANLWRMKQVQNSGDSTGRVGRTEWMRSSSILGRTTRTVLGLWLCRRQMRLISWEWMRGIRKWQLWLLCWRKKKCSKAKTEAKMNQKSISTVQCRGSAKMMGGRESCSDSTYVTDRVEGEVLAVWWVSWERETSITRPEEYMSMHVFP